MAASNPIPTNLDKLLFAEDFVNYVMSLHTYDKPQQCTAEPYRKTLYNGFNAAAKEAVRFLDDEGATFEHLLFHYIHHVDDVNLSTYVKFAKEMQQHKFPNGFDAKNFYPLCFQFALFAAYCYNHGVMEAPTLAVLYIKNAMQGFDMDNGGWEYLNRIAEYYVSLVQAWNELESKTSDDETTEFKVDELPHQNYTNESEYDVANNFSKLDV